MAITEKVLKKIITGAVPAAGEAVSRTAKRAAALAAKPKPKAKPKPTTETRPKLPPRQGPLSVDATLGLPEDMQMPVTFGGKDVADFEPQDWGMFGQLYGVPNLGPTSNEAWRASLIPVRTATGREVTIPGGEGPYTYYDLLHLKSQGINPNDLPPELHRDIHNRMVGAMQGSSLSDERIANQMIFGMISPNQPLTPNELALQRAMVKGPQDLERLGGMAGYRYTEGVPPKPARDETSRQITEALGLQAAGRGGLGASGSANYTDIAEFAQKMQDRPDFFRFNPNDNTLGGMSDAEKWSTHVSRVMNEIRGLKAKTGSLATVWQDPQNAAISAIDRHMAGLFNRQMFPDQKEFAAWERATVAKYNKGRPKAERVKTIDELRAAPGGRGVFVDNALAYVNNLPAAKTRAAKTGEFNPRIPMPLRETDWVGGEPAQMQMIQGAYPRALEANAARAAQEGQGLFSNQWMLWDRIRNRLEPHEVLFPGLEKLPRMNMEQMRRVRGDLSKAGYMAAEGGVRPLPNASRAAYFSLGAAAPAAGLLGMSPEEAAAAEIEQYLKGKNQ